MRRLLSAALALCLAVSCQAQSQEAEPSLEDVLMPAAAGSQIISHTNYTVSYNRQLKIPNWVSWSIDPDELKKNVSRYESNFVPDPGVRGVSVSTHDYSRSGYDRGHMCPAADNRYDLTAMQESFYLTNVCPQKHSLNDGAWNDLEMACRYWAGVGTVYIVCGPYFKGTDRRRTFIGSNQVAVPDGFWKVVLRYYKGAWHAIGFKFPNGDAKGNFKDYAVTVDEIEKLTGYDFFSALDDETENQAEATVTISRWPFTPR